MLDTGKLMRKGVGWWPEVEGTLLMPLLTFKLVLALTGSAMGPGTAISLWASCDILTHIGPCIRLKEGGSIDLL